MTEATFAAGVGLLAATCIFLFAVQMGASPYGRPGPVALDPRHAARLRVLQGLAGPAARRVMALGAGGAGHDALAVLEKLVMLYAELAAAAGELRRHGQDPTWLDAYLETLDETVVAIDAGLPPRPGGPQAPEWPAIAIELEAAGAALQRARQLARLPEPGAGAGPAVGG